MFPHRTGEETQAWRNGNYVTWVAKVVSLFREGEGRLPKDLAEVFAARLPTGRSDDPKTDLFGHPLEYAVDAERGTFSLRSLGKDGRPGGRGADADAGTEGP